MKATIWHNPSCGTSRKTLAILEEAPGIEPEVVLYLTNPPTADKLTQLYAMPGSPRNRGCACAAPMPRNAACRRPVMPPCWPPWRPNRA